MIILNLNKALDCVKEDDMRVKGVNCELTSDRANGRRGHVVPIPHNLLKVAV